ncbi:hypothetical protein [Vallicoccus soli]|uniref:PPM-type phosphatase domain-containing protein n=1 Tax=Vallicoccus soli TaxID=2339232 RepID=A0A3A3YYR0_9ACTN|nr:hypothetical protein [Vallicoccus soli]RJK95972.1 hypothetical protein D5H78_10330 [Vallicoccus soli]
MRTDEGPPLQVRPTHALLLTTANGVLAGVAGVTSPVGWVLVPGTLALLVRHRLALAVCAWAGALIAAGIAVPLVPGHRTDELALAVSAAALLALPALGALWRAAEGPARDGVRVSGAAVAGRRAVRAVPERVPAPLRNEVAVAGPDRPGDLVAVAVRADGTVRVLVAAALAGSGAPGLLARRVPPAFRRLAGGPAGLDDLAVALDLLVGGLAPSARLSAVLLDVPPAGPVLALRLGAPPVLHAVGAGSADAAAGLAGPAGLPLGGGAHGQLAVLPAGGACALVTDAFDLVHVGAGAEVAGPALAPVAAGGARPVTALAVLLAPPGRAGAAAGAQGPVVVVRTGTAAG